MESARKGGRRVVQPDVPQSVNRARWSRRARESQDGGQMVAGSDHASIPARRLAERLRDLREREFRPLTQRVLGKALGGSDPLSIATVSLWENPSSERLPPPQRLRAYARLFCSSRSFASATPRLLRDDELTDAEREREIELYEELLDLRERAQSTDAATAPSEQFAIEYQGSLWRFPDESAISIVCSDAPRAERPAYADQAHLNYSRYARHADLDALIEVYGQVKSRQPGELDKDPVAQVSRPRFRSQPPRYHRRGGCRRCGTVVHPGRPVADGSRIRRHLHLHLRGRRGTPRIHVNTR